VDETWQFNSEDGNSVDIALQYVRGTPVRSKIDAKVYSAERPDFYRIYQGEQLTDLVSSAGTGTDRLKKFAIKATGSKLAPLFGGAHRLISTSSLPWYNRQTYLPGS
jgi:hypothetical protein